MLRSVKANGRLAAQRIADQFDSGHQSGSSQVEKNTTCAQQRLVNEPFLIPAIRFSIDYSKHFKFFTLD